MKASNRTGQKGQRLDYLMNFKIPKTYTLTAATGIESVVRAEKEDHKRLLSIIRALKNLPPGLQRQRATKLDRKLSEEATPKTLASSRHYRDLRVSIIPHIWKLVNETLLGPVRTVTILVKGWQFSPEELHLVDPNQLLEVFRADLNRCCIKDVGGFAFFALHGEYNEVTSLFDIHIHGIVSGNMTPVFDRLRKRPKYRSYQDEQEGVKQRIHRVVVTDKPLTNLPAPITYVMQSWWPAKETYIKDGKTLRRRSRKRIPDFPHLLWLLWMDCWDISDLTLMMGMRVSKNRGLYVLEKRTRT